jgi:hypothetical protein
MKNTRCVFTSAGDNHNVHSWVSGLKNPKWDLVTAFYGDSDEKYDEIRKISKMSFRVKGSKFQNLKKIYDRQPALLQQYSFIWISDDDLILDPADIDRLFSYAENYDFWICQPAFSGKGRISHPVTAWAGEQSSVRIVNFVEVTCPLFRKDKLDEFMRVYDGDLIGWGIDWWFCNYFDANRMRKHAVIDEVVVLNPHEFQRNSGEREILKLQSDAMREARWMDLANNLGLSQYHPTTLAWISEEQPRSPYADLSLASDVVSNP